MNKKIFITAVLGGCCLFLISCASSNGTTRSAEIQMSYQKLKLLDLDQMTEIIQQNVKAAKNTNSLQPLEEGLEICLSRPDEDGLVEKTISLIKNPLDDNNAWEPTVDALVDKSIAIMTSKDSNPTDQLTAGFILENLIAELKPEFTKQYESAGFETRTIERIAKAEIEFSAAAVQERNLSLMRGTAGPSKVAQQILMYRSDVLKAKPKIKNKK